jgi:hypothetical protein
MAPLMCGTGGGMRKVAQGVVDDKKRVELAYLEEARRASSIFPPGELVPHERPDFLLPTATGKIGIEVTELCREAERREGARLHNVPRKAQAYYRRLRDPKPVSVSPAFHRAEEVPFQQLVESLALFVHSHRNNHGNFNRGLPRGYCHIGVFEPIEQLDGDKWRCFAGFDVVLAPKELIEHRIAEKNDLVAAYRESAPEAWLLIVNDQFLGAGEVCARPDQVAEWTFDFAFDKVLLFVRQPGGSGQVIELRRQ